MFDTNYFKIFHISVEPLDNEINKNEFSVIISDNVKKNVSKYSIINAVKPFVYFLSLFGTQTVRYLKNDIVTVNALNKLYSLLFVVLMGAIMCTLKPTSWSETKTDVPLNILTKTYGILHLVEVYYSMLTVSFASSRYFVNIIKTLDDIDDHFGTSKKMFLKRRIITATLMIFAILQLSLTLFIRKFKIHNIGPHLSFFIILLQGTMIIFFVINIYTSQLMLNSLILNKISKNLKLPKQFIYEDSMFDKFVKHFISEPCILERKLNSHYCWFELMGIYDKIADCIYFFNKIYMGQVLMMFGSWLICTLLLICRSLSPSLKYSEHVISDLIVYSSINIRPFYLAIMCELFIIEKNKTLSILRHILVHDDVDRDYYNQVQTMLDLVSARPVKVSANVFTVDIPTVMNFAGKVISYTVLMIQYFYMHVFLKKVKENE